MLYNLRTKIARAIAPKAPPAGRGTEWEPTDRDNTDKTRAITPDLVDAILASANAGDTANMCRASIEIEEKNWDIFQALQTRRLAVAGTPWEILPPKGNDSQDAKNNAADVEALLRDADAPPPAGLEEELDTFESVLTFELMGALLPGFAVCELVWGPGGRELQGLVPIEQKHFTFRDSRTPLLVTTDHPEGTSLEHNKFLKHRYQARPGARCRGGLIRPLLWMHMFSSINYKDLQTFVERYGMPFIMAHVGQEAWERDRNRIKYLIQNFGAAGGAVFSDAVQTELLQASPNTGDVYFRLLEHMGDAITKVVLGQTATSSDGGGLSKDNAQSDVRQDILESDCHALEGTSRAGLIAPWIAWNKGEGSPVPRLHFLCEPDEDLVQRADTLAKLKQAGLDADPAEQSEAFGYTLRTSVAAAPAAAPDPDDAALEGDASGGRGISTPRTPHNMRADSAQGAIPARAAILPSDGRMLRGRIAMTDAAGNPIGYIALEDLIPSIAASAIAPRVEPGAAPVSARSNGVSEGTRPLGGGSGAEPLTLSLADADNGSLADIALSEFLAGQGLREWFGTLQAAIEAAVHEPDARRFVEKIRDLTSDLPGLYDRMDTAAFEDILERTIYSAAANGKADQAAKLAAKERDPGLRTPDSGLPPNPGGNP